MAEKKTQGREKSRRSTSRKQDRLTTQHFRQLAQARVIHINVIHYEPLAKTCHQRICNWQ